ncbi:MAG: YdeI/OmpD-associated family protein [Gemmatimonadales bacterium]
MGRKDPRVDAYIAKSADFAKPILEHLRKIVHKGCPEVVEEIKWNTPHFSYKGMFCGMAAFKAHSIFGFWKHSLLVGRVKGMPKVGTPAWGTFGRLTSLDDLPTDATLLAAVKEAKRLNDEGVKPPKRKVIPAKDRVLQVPDYFMRAVRRDKKALAYFGGASYSCRKEYVQWVTEAKAEETRERRLKTAVEWMSRGKNRNWKYENC